MAEKQEARSIPQIEADLAATRQRLADNVDTLLHRVSPAELQRRGVEALKAKANDAVFTPEGTPRWDRFAVALGVVAGVAVTLGLARRAFHR